MGRVVVLWPEVMLKSVEGQLQPWVGYLRGLGCTTSQVADVVGARGGRGVDVGVGVTWDMQGSRARRQGVRTSRIEGLGLGRTWWVQGYEDGVGRGRVGARWERRGACGG